MARYIVKLERDGEARYMEWSTVSDRPATKLLTLPGFKAYYLAEYGRQGAESLPARLKRVEATGSSVYGETAEYVIAGNRAGPNETELTEAEIWEAYS